VFARVLYLAIVLDVWTRGIIGWTMGTTRQTSLGPGCGGMSDGEVR
jgi:transposase InsO family protein